MAAPMSKRDVDVFDNSDVESDIFSLENTTWIRLEEQKHKEGYRNGIEIGEEASLQRGHNDGYQRTSCLFHLAKIHGSVAAVRSYLSVFDGNATASLRADSDRLEADVQKLEQALKQSLVASQCQHSCDTTTNIVSQLSDNCVSDDSTLSARQCDRTTHVAEPGLVETNTSLKQVLDSDRHDDGDHRTVRTDTSLCRCQQLLPTHQHCHAADSSHGPCYESPMSVFTDTQCLCQYNSCCSKLDQLVSVCVSLSQ